MDEPQNQSFYEWTISSVCYDVKLLSLTKALARRGLRAADDLRGEDVIPLRVGGVFDCDTLEAGVEVVIVHDPSVHHYTNVAVHGRLAIVPVPARGHIAAIAEHDGAGLDLHTAPIACLGLGEVEGEVPNGIAVHQSGQGEAIGVLVPGPGRPVVDVGLAGSVCPTIHREGEAGVLHGAGQVLAITVLVDAVVAHGDRVLDHVRAHTRVVVVAIPVDLGEAVAVVVDVEAERRVGRDVVAVQIAKGGVAGVADAVAVLVDLVVVGHVRAVVAGVAGAVVVGVGLVGVGHVRAVVGVVVDAVVIGVDAVVAAGTAAAALATRAAGAVAVVQDTEALGVAVTVDGAVGIAAARGVLAVGAVLAGLPLGAGLTGLPGRARLAVGTVLALGARGAVPAVLAVGAVGTVLAGGALGAGGTGVTLGAGVALLTLLTGRALRAGLDLGVGATHEDEENDRHDPRGTVAEARLLGDRGVLRHGLDS